METITDITGQYLNNPDQTLFTLKEGKETVCCHNPERCAHTPNWFQENTLLPGEGVTLEFVWQEGESDRDERELFFRIRTASEVDRFLVLTYRERYSSLHDYCQVIGSDKLPEYVSLVA